MFVERIAAINQQFLEELQTAASAEAVEKVRIEYVGRHGHLTVLLGGLKDLSIEQKREFGPLLNKLKEDILLAIEAKHQELMRVAMDTIAQQQKHFDVTAYLPSYHCGSSHPCNRIVQDMSTILTSMGYEYAEGPEVETPEYNFDALNIPANHPARDLHDTFWLTNAGFLLRTHTSSVQIRTLRKRKPPIAIFAPGRTFRHEATDATHDFVFMQIEGMYIAEGVSLAHLLATLTVFLQKLFENETIKIRVRPSYFPFVEPGLEVDISCPFCTEGCAVCKHTRWVELGGAGLVHPNVIASCNLDPEKYSGFAFGLGIDRLAMMKYNINDVRLLRSGKIDFLRQF